MSIPAVQHLVALWNPTYAEDPLEAHIQVLLRHVEVFQNTPALEDGPYVWWGLVKSPNRQKPLPHSEELRALTAALAAEPDVERHLYLTDYRSLVVAHLDEIVFEQPDDSEHIPPYYEKHTLRCDAWFRLLDLRVVVRDDLPSVIRELKALRNVRYSDRPVSLYGGMVDLPLIVVRHDEQTWFSDQDYAPLDDALWVEFDRAHGSAVGRMTLELRENVLGVRCWDALQQTTRTFLATAEAEWRDRCNQPGHDFSGSLLQFAKGIEVEANAAMRRVLRNIPSTARQANLDGRTVDLLEHPNLTLGSLAYVLRHEPALFHAVATKGAEGRWFVEQFAPYLEELRSYRNDASHTGSVTREQVHRMRNRLLGVGCEAELIRLARVGRDVNG